MRKQLNARGVRNALVALSLLSIVSTSTGTARAADADYALSPVPGASTAQRSAAVSKFKYMFGAPARWPGVMHWRYNHTGAPTQFSNAKDAVIHQIVAESAKWTAVCGVQIAYDGETTAVPKTLAAGAPDGISVIGWQKPDIGISGATYLWYQTNGSSALTLVDADMMLDPAYVTTTAQLTSTVSHEWGHAVGLAHSNLERTLMSGPPDSAYTNDTGLAPDDVHGCRCLYGPPAGQSAANVCSLPEIVDFGTLTAGVASSESPITVTNSGNATLTISGVRTGTGDFLVGSNGCTPGTALAPGASCTFGVQARLAKAGDRSDEVTIDTSEGPYRVPLDATGVGAPQAPAQTLAPNFEGSWWTAPAGSESGWGLNFAHQGDVIFATVFTYDATGKTWWLSMTANRLGNDNVFSGTLYETRGPAFNTVPFDSKAVTYHAVGTGTLDFNDADNGTFSYSVNGIAQSKPVTRTVFGNLPVCTTSAAPSALTTATNYQDIWWAAVGTGETGWGLHFTHQGDIIFATWFTYDFDGSPLWLSVTAPKGAAGVYTGTLYRTTGPSFGSVPFDPAQVVRTPVGNATLTFGNGDNATFAYSVTLGSPAVTVTQAKQLTRLVFRAPGTVCR